LAVATGSTALRSAAATPQIADVVDKHRIPFGIVRRSRDDQKVAVNRSTTALSQTFCGNLWQLMVEQKSQPNKSALRRSVSALCSLFSIQRGCVITVKPGQDIDA